MPNCPFNCSNCNNADANGSGGGFPSGYMALLSFPADELPPGWYFCNNDRYASDSVQGIALNGLTDKFKTLWSITEVEGSINVPNLFSDDGRGMFIRAVNGTTRQVGSVEDDAIRNLTGHIGMVQEVKSKPSSGIVVRDLYESSVAWNGGGNGYYNTTYVDIDASIIVPTSYDNHPLNVGMTPAIYLGV